GKAVQAVRRRRPASPGAAFGLQVLASEVPLRPGEAAHLRPLSARLAEGGARAARRGEARAAGRPGPRAQGRGGESAADRPDAGTDLPLGSTTLACSAGARLEAASRRGGAESARAGGVPGDRRSAAGGDTPLRHSADYRRDAGPGG